MVVLGKTSSWQLVLGKPIAVLGKTYFLFGACRGRQPFLRLQSAVNLGKTLLREKTFIFRKNPWPFGKTYIGKNLFRKTHCLFEKDLFRKTRDFIWKKLLGRPVWEKTYSFCYQGSSLSWNSRIPIEPRIFCHLLDPRQSANSKLVS